MTNKQSFGIVDIFAGPGGLSEGFAMAGDFDNRPFKIALSIEKDSAAHRTLRLRSLVHELNEAEFERYIELLNNNGSLEESLFEAAFPEKWRTAVSIARCYELSEKARPQTESYLDNVREEYGTRTGLIGGPPCQVYSLVGRSRNARNHLYQGDDDHRHTLYKEYIHVLDYLKPAFFVMENVKGMLSSKHQSQQIFPLVRQDLESAGNGYRLIALAPRSDRTMALSAELETYDHQDFLVRMEEFGVPQNRHRIIIVGLRNDVFSNMSPDQLQDLQLIPSPRSNVRAMIGHLPALRSGLSKHEDSPHQWSTVLQGVLQTLSVISMEPEVQSEIARVMTAFQTGEVPQSRLASRYSSVASALGAAARVQTRNLTRLHHHETRSHLETDLARYIYAAAFAEVHDRSPRAADFPDALAPDHRNWNSGNFNDRFRVQTWKEASSTVMSHISKDGHYYIHPDPVQARSLTVREAARLQTFPDDYIFLGNRTSKFHQVGNAVPPYLARQIAMVLNRILG